MDPDQLAKIFVHFPFQNLLDFESCYAFANQLFSLGKKDTPTRTIYGKLKSFLCEQTKGTLNKKAAFQLLRFLAKLSLKRYLKV